MQEILLKLGYACNFFEVNGVGFSKNSKIYHLRISKEQIFGGYPKKEDYHGYVYCVTVRNHIILVRRNGKIAWSGNCGYHGWSDWYLAANLADKKGLDGHLLPGLHPLGVPRGLKGTSIPFEYDKAEQLERIMENSKDVGTIVLEPMRHNFPKKEFVDKVQKMAADNGAVLLIDEVTSGWRMRVGGVYELVGIKPDLAVYGKAMSNGYPMAAIVGKAEVMDAAQTSFISSTYWTERIGPTAALATIAKLERENVPAHLRRMGRKIGDGWTKLAGEKGLDIGVLFDFEPLIAFNLNYREKSQAISTLFTQEMLERGYLASKSVYVSYSHKDADVERYLGDVGEVFGIMKKAIDEKNVEKRLKGPVAHEGFRRLTS
jgi:glutamate-1-semialdehyde aminotransferase